LTLDIRADEIPDPANNELEALFRAGLRFEADGAFDLADQNYRQALKLLKPGDKKNFNALHYSLGRVAEALGRSEEAEEHYIQVAASDQS
jgi:tetratricopeptide (TPR) repeat protein